MKIKVRPEDFVVQEAAELSLRKRGEYAVYVLRKRGWNTADAVRRIAGMMHLPLSQVAYGGKKDRHALTRQYISVKRRSGKGFSHAPARMQEGDISVELAGYMDRPMGPDLIAGNRFELIVRDIKKEELDKALSEAEKVRRSGYPNYFDDQRFGSYDPEQGYIAEKIIKGHYNGALKIYLTHAYSEDKRPEKERKRWFSDNWGRWARCLERAATEFEKTAFGYLRAEPKGFIPVLQRVGREDMSIFIAAYQSSVWNETLRRLVSGLAGRAVKHHPGFAGDYVFYETLCPADLGYMKRLNFPVPAATAQMPDKRTDLIYRAVLEEAGVKPAMFNTRNMRQAFFKPFGRDAVVNPSDLSITPGDDEMYPGRLRLTLAFTLPRGSYATMFVKRLFAE